MCLDLGTAVFGVPGWTGMEVGMHPSGLSARKMEVVAAVVRDPKKVDAMVAAIRRAEEMAKKK